MTKNNIQIRLGVIALMILLAAFSRIVPHMANFSPLGAIALFGAAYFSKKWQAFFIPVAATWLSDLFINNVIYGQYYATFTWFYQGFYWQYGSYLLIAFMGLHVLKQVTPIRTVAAALGSSALFFLVSNFGCWVSNPLYTQDFAGLLACYAAGLPFLKGTLLGDLFYVAVLAGIFELVQNRFPSIRTAHVQA